MENIVKKNRLTLEALSDKGGNDKKTTLGSNSSFHDGIINESCHEYHM